MEIELTSIIPSFLVDNEIISLSNLRGAREAFEYTAFTDPILDVDVRRGCIRSWICNFSNVHVQNKRGVTATQKAGQEIHR